MLTVHRSVKEKKKKSNFIQRRRTQIILLCILCGRWRTSERKAVEEGWKKKRKATRMCSYVLENEKYFRACGGGSHKMHRAAATAAAVAAVRALLGQMQLWKATRNVCNWDRSPVVLSGLCAFKGETEKESVPPFCSSVRGSAYAFARRVLFC